MPEDEIWDLPGEIWKDIPWCPNYQVSNKGRVRSLGYWIEYITRNGNLARQYSKPRIRKAQPNMKKGGHLSLYLGPKKSRKRYYVHSLVAEMFIGPRPDGLIVCHNDSNPMNNCVENLRYDTKAGNAYDMIRLGNKWQQKLTEDDVVCIRRELKDGKTTKDLASEYGVTPEMIRNIRRGDAWAWSHREAI